MSSAGGNSEFSKIQADFEKQWHALKAKHLTHLSAIETMKSTQVDCSQAVKHCKSYLYFINKEISKLEKSATPEEKKKLSEEKLELQRKEVELRNIEDVLPRRPGLYLRVVLGALNISLSSKQDKFAYKNDYEQFKIVVSAISAVFAFLLYFFIQNRVLDTVFHFLLVWYYCTLTIRERILIANGSRIKGWWNVYHFISTASAGIMLIWPRSQSYDQFRDQFMLFSLYLNIVHCFQYQYQVGCLYKLRALGAVHLMYITVDGFKSWMFKRLTFIIPFLFGAYAFEAYNAYFLYEVSRQPYCQEWQVVAVAILEAIQVTGNLITLCFVLRQKFRSTTPVDHYRLKSQYHFTDPKKELEGDGSSTKGSTGPITSEDDTLLTQRQSLGNQ